MTQTLPDLNQLAGVLSVIKRPIPVGVLFADGEGLCSTREGRVGFLAGDALLRGVEGEYWPIERARFDSSYKPVAGVKHGEAGLYVKKPISVLAIQLSEPMDVPVGWQNDPLHGEPGDWLLQYGPGDYGVVGQRIFARTYDIVKN